MSVALSALLALSVGAQSAWDAGQQSPPGQLCESGLWDRSVDPSSALRTLLENMSGARFVASKGSRLNLYECGYLSGWSLPSASALVSSLGNSGSLGRAA